MRAVMNFTISPARISDVSEMVRALVMVKKASDMAKADARHPVEKADSIIAACDEILGDGRWDGPVPC